MPSGFEASLSRSSEQLPTVMRTVDASIAKRVEALLSRHGVIVKTGTSVDAILPKGERLQVRCATGLSRRPILS